MGNGLSDTTGKKVVIVGGGYAGMELAALLKKWHVPFLLIDQKEFFYHYTASVRGIVDKEFVKKIMIRFEPTFGESFLLAKVVRVDLNDKKVFVDSGESITYSHLVISVGSVGTFPGFIGSGSVKDGVEELNRISSQVEEAKRILIIGGGAAGVEVAGEIRHLYKDKQISIIHSQTKLIGPWLRDSIDEKLKSLLESENITVHYDERVINIESATFNICSTQSIVTTKGNTYEADLLLRCIGLKPNISLSETIFDESKFDEEMRLKVTPHLTVEGFDNVYAMGDCCNTKEAKMALQCKEHARIVANNIWNDLKGNPQRLNYKTRLEAMIITVGPCAGSGFISSFTLPSFAVSLVKGRSMLAPMFWGAMNQSEPHA